MKDVAVDLRQLKREYDSGAVVTVKAHMAAIPTAYLSKPVAIPEPPKSKSNRLLIFVPLGLLALLLIAIGIYEFASRKNLLNRILNR